MLSTCSAAGTAATAAAVVSADEGAAAAPGRPALVQGDARTPFAAMTRALEAVGEAGITEVRFAAEPAASR